MLSPSSRSPPSSSVFEKKPPPHLRRLAKPTSGGQEGQKRQPTCQVRARDQCVVKSLQMRRFTKSGKEPSRGNCRAIATPCGAGASENLIAREFHGAAQLRHQVQLWGR